MREPDFFRKEATEQELVDRYVRPAMEHTFKMGFINMYRQGGLDLNYETGEVREIATGKIIHRGRLQSPQPISDTESSN